MASASATISFVIPVSSRILLGTFPAGRTSSFSTRSRQTPSRVSLRMTAISMIASRSGLSPVVSMSRAQNPVASRSGSSRSTGRSRRGRRLPRTVKSVAPSASTSCTPTAQIPAMKPTANALRTLSVILITGAACAASSGHPGHPLPSPGLCDVGVRSDAAFAAEEDCHQCSPQNLELLYTIGFRRNSTIMTEQHIRDLLLLQATRYGDDRTANQ